MHLRKNTWARWVLSTEPLEQPVCLLESARGEEVLCAKGSCDGMLLARPILLTVEPYLRLRVRIKARQKMSRRRVLWGSTLQLCKVMVRCLSLALLLAASALGAQDYGARLGNVKRGGKVSWEPAGPGVLFDALDPSVRKWYVPQELYAEYGWSSREYSNYANQLYQRYVSTALEGD